MHSVLVRQLRKAGLSAEAPPDAEAWRALLDRVSKTYQTADQDKALLERSLSLSSEEMRAALQESRALNAALADSTEVLENSRLEASIARSAAESANLAKSCFLANMSHEIRTPMTAILGYAELLEEADVEERRSHVHTIRRSGEHLLGIINDILDVSKIEAGKMTVELISCSPIAIVREIVKLSGPRAQAKGVALRVTCEEGVPEAITSDPTRLRQVISNLVDNAIKFTAKGSVDITLRAGAGRSARHQIEIAVADSGIGMAQEKLANLFRPFAQADSSTTRKYGGTGLGLVISRHLTELMGGELTVVSTPDHGCTFTVSIPTGARATVPAAPQPAAPEIPVPAGPHRPSLAGLRILLAEDGLDNQRLIAFHLRRAGAHVDIADNGRIATDMVGEQPYDVILMDMQMPELDGYAATALLRQRRYDAPIVALTAHAMDGDRALCIEAGCDDYATKPFDTARLLALCAHWARTGRAAGVAASAQAA